MFVLNQFKWTQHGFKMTPDKTLAWMVTDDQLVYVRPYDEENYGGTDRPNEPGSVVGRVYTLADTNEKIAVFIGNDPFAYHDSVSFNDTILPGDAMPDRDIYSKDKAAALMVPFNRASKGYIPIVWNLGSKESICNINASIENIGSVYQLESRYPSVNLPEEASFRYMVMKLRDRNNQLFGYNRNHLAYNGRLDDASQDYPLACNIYLSAKNREIPNETNDGHMAPPTDDHTASVIHDESYYKSIHKVEKLNRQASKWSDREDKDLGLPTDDKPYNKSGGFNGKANGLLDAAALAGAVSKGE